jgi:hypothetical protein
MLENVGGRMNKEAIRRANQAILERLAGVPANPGFVPANYVKGGDDPSSNRSSGDECSERDSTSGSDLAPQQAAPTLRLVWSAPPPTKHQP